MSKQTYFILFAHGWETVTRKEYNHYTGKGYAGKIIRD